MPTALVIGGTGFVGSHTAIAFAESGYDVTVLSRTEPNSSSPNAIDVAHLAVDRTDAEALAEAADSVEPDVVVDCAAFRPGDVSTAIDVFADVDAYVYVSSGGVYARDDLPKRESTTPLHDFEAAHPDDDSMATYGPRKAEADRLATAAAADGVAAMSVRPTMIYGPKRTPLGEVRSADGVAWAPDVPGLQEHHDYWIDRLDRFDRVLVPGDGTAIWHRVYVEDLARAIRVVAERGEPGEAYNVADRRVLTLEDVLELIAEALGTSVEVVHAGRRELARVDLEPDDFVLYHHYNRNYPHVLSTCKLAALGWDSTPPDVAMEHTVEESLASDRDGAAFDPGRAAEERLLDELTS